MPPRAFLLAVWDAEDMLKTWRRATQQTSLEMQDTFYPLPYEGRTATTNHSTHICRLCCTLNQNWTFTETHICSMIFVLPICIQRGTVFFDVTLKFPMLRWRVDLTGSQLANRRATKVGCAARVIETCSHSCMLYDVYCTHYVWLSMIIYVYIYIHMCFIFTLYKLVPHAMFYGLYMCFDYTWYSTR